jgi:murein DD-endopeptidase MepM/ murein hydrolase activator NlpD
MCRENGEHKQNKSGFSIHRKRSEYKHLASSLIAITLFVAALAGTFVPEHVASALIAYEVDRVDEAAENATDGLKMSQDSFLLGRDVSQLTMRMPDALDNVEESDATIIEANGTLIELDQSAAGATVWDGSFVGTMVWPVDWFINGERNIGCGFRCGCGWHGGRHAGLDLGTFGDTPPALAAAPGRVVFADWDGGYGNTVEIDHGDGIRTRYSHLSSIAVAVDQIMSTGELVGYVGSTGNSSGNHLHFEVFVNGAPVDPMNYL